VTNQILARTPNGATRAEALFLRGRGEGLLERLDAAEATLTEAITVGEQARANHAVAQSWVELVQVTGAQNHRFEAARANMRAAEAVFARVDPGPVLRARYGYIVGAMLLARGALDESRTYLERAVVAPDTYAADRGTIHAALCDLYRQQREIDKARTACETAVEMLSASYGPEHVRLGLVHNVWGAVELAARKHDVAREHWERAIKIFEARNMPNDRGYALAQSNIGVSWNEQGDLDKARPYFERAKALFAKYHPDHVQRTLPLQGLASIALQKKDYSAAIAAYGEVLAVIEHVYGKEDDRRLTVLYNPAIAYQRLPDLDRALALTDEIITRAQRVGHEQWMMLAYALDMQAALVEKTSKNWDKAIELRTRALAALDHQDDANLRAWIRMEIGRVMRSAGKIKESIPHLEHAVAYFTKDRVDLYVSGTSQYWLGKSLWETGGDRKRAIELVRAASADLQAVKTGFNIETHRKQVADWLAKHK
jgi:tetratricopeptide (TPR) repeat protein